MGVSQWCLLAAECPTLDAIIKGLFARCIVLCSCASIKYASILSYSLFIRSRLGFPLPDLSGELQIAVGTAGPQPRAPDLSGHCWTSAASSTSQRALPHLNCELQIAAGTAPPQQRAPDLSGHCGPQPRDLSHEALAVEARQCPC